MLMALNDLTIVIPTLPRDYGARWNKQILDYLDQGIKVVLSVPPDWRSYLTNLTSFPWNSNDIIIFECSKKGQVVQRFEASRSIESIYSLFMDDDIYISVNDLSILMYDLQAKLPRPSALSPRFRTTFPGRLQSVPHRATFADRLRTIVLYLIHGTYARRVDFLYGKILPSGAALPYPPNLPYNKPMPSEWLPGGCFLMLTEFIRLDYSYILPGKAFCEDLFHSNHLSKNGISMFFHNTVFAYTPPLSPLTPKTMIPALNEWFFSAKARFSFCLTSGRVPVHVVIFSLYDFFRIIVRSLFFA